MFKINFFKVVLKITLVLVILGAIIFGLALQINLLARKTGEERDRLEATREKENSKQDLVRDWEEVKGTIPVLEKAIPSEKNIVDFIASLEQIAATTGNKQELSFATASAGDDFSEEKTTKQKSQNNLEFSISLEGNLSGLRNYLAALEGLPYIVEIKNVKTTGENLDQICTTMIEAVVYIKKDEA